MKRRAFQYFTVVLLIVSVWTVYANVLSDDSDVRTKAKHTVYTAAGCGDSCQMEAMRGERGMLSETIEYDLTKYGHYVVVCKRSAVIIGEYACNVTEGKINGPSAATPDASSAPSSSAAGSASVPARKTRPQ